MVLSATLYKPDGSQMTIVPENGTDFSLEELYRHLDCDTFEMIQLNNEAHPDDPIMLGDEEARFKDGCQENAEATKIYRESWGITDPQKAWADHMEAAKQANAIVMPFDGPGEPFNVVGNVIVCPSRMLK